MQRPAFKHAFTLIELLVVIAIIAILLSVLMPSLRACKTMCRRAISGSNMRQIGLALRMYADDNRGRMPETTHGLPHYRSWVFTLGPYLGEVDKVRICPADPQRNERAANESTSYVLNEYLAVAAVDPFGRVIESFTNLHELRSPGTVVTTFVGADDMATDVSADHTHGRLWFAAGAQEAWGRICEDIGPDRYRAGSRAADQTRGSSNYLYADSHVEAIGAVQVKKWADGGVNFARPGR